MATIAANSASRADIQAAINSSADGDTVTVPAGSATWTSAVDLGTKRISLIAAGASQTLITDGAADSGAGFIFTIAASSSFLPVRISGFSIATPQTGNKGFRIAITGPNIIRIDNNKFSGGYNYISPNW